MKSLIEQQLYYKSMTEYSVQQNILQKPNLVRKTIHGLLWTYTANYTGKLMVLISTIILARLLQQEDFGIAGYALVFIGFLKVLEGLGIGSALIYHHDDSDQTNTAFWLGLSIGVTLFVVTWLAAPLAGWFFQDSRAIPITRVLGITFPVSAFGLVHQALLRKELAFRQIFFAGFIQSLGKGLTSVVLALFGFGAWSLIIGQLTGTTTAVMAYWYIFRWRPAFRFHREYAPSLLSYGLNIATVNILGVFLNNLDYLLIGRFLGAAALGIYTLGFRIPELLIREFCAGVTKVVFPAYSKIRDDHQSLAEGILNTIRYVTLVTIPLGLGLALVARPFVVVVFGEKWIEAIPVMQAIAIYILLKSLVMNIGDVYKAQGRPELLTKLSLIRAGISLPLLLWVVTGPGTIIAVGWAQAAVMFIGASLNFAVAGHLLKISYKKMFQSFQPAIIGSLFMIPAVLSILHVTANIPASGQLLAAVTIGGISYSGALWWFQRHVILVAHRTLSQSILSKK